MSKDAKIWVGGCAIFSVALVILMIVFVNGVAESKRQNDVWTRMGHRTEDTYRMPVIGGWLVRSRKHMVFVADPEHTWRQEP